MKITLETRKKLKSLNLFQENYLGSPAEWDLPDPTLEELIEAIESKVDKWEEGAYQIDYSMDTNTNTKHYSIFLYKKDETSNMLIADSLDDCLAKAIIWLYEEER